MQFKDARVPTFATAHTFCHPRRPRGSQSRAGEISRQKFSRTEQLLRPFLKTFAAQFRPPPTDCPWVSEDDVLRISQLGFPMVLPNNTGIFLRGLKLSGKSRT